MPSVCSRDPQPGKRKRSELQLGTSIFSGVCGAEASLQLVLSMGTRRKTTRLDLFYQSPVKHEFVVIGMTS